METTDEELQFDDMVDILTDKRRRDLLLALSEHNPQPAPAVATATATNDTGDSVAMRHMHLPKLTDHGVINWDREDHEITKGPSFNEIKPLLVLLDDHADELPADW